MYKSFLKSLNNLKTQSTDLMNYGTIQNLIKTEKIFKVLEDGDLYSFHEFLFNLGQSPHGIGIGTLLIAQVNAAGYLLSIGSKLNHLFSQEILNEIIKGETLVSLAVSEPNWKGKLINLTTKLEISEGNFLLNGFKSFISNCLDSKYIIVVSKKDNSQYQCSIVRKEDSQNKIEQINFPYLKEVSHCKANFENTKVPKEWILPFNYKEYSEEVQFNEYLSLNFLGLGFIHNILSKNTERIEHLNLKKFLKKMDWLHSYLNKISHDKTFDSNLNLKNYYPYGLEILIEELEAKVGEDHWNELVSNFNDLQFFLMSQKTMNYYFLRKQN
jgi:hypothetical protein